jgi:hypothetical protein
MRHPPNHPLDDFQGPLRTHVGAIFPGERAVFRGYDIHRDLADIHWVEMLVFSATGKRYTPGQVRVFNAMMTYTSYPDSRIWNNRVAALAGSARSTGNLAISAAQAVSEAAIFGRQIDYRALDFLTRARAAKERGENLAEFVVADLARYRSVAGFGRPLTAKDERMVPMLALLEEEGLNDGPFLRLAREVEAVLLAGRWRYSMNYAGLVAAIFGDFGLTAEQYVLAAFPVFVAGMIPCYQEAREKPAGAIMPLRCEEVEYVGPVARPW